MRRGSNGPTGALDGSKQPEVSRGSLRDYEVDVLSPIDTIRHEFGQSQDARALA